MIFISRVLTIVVPMIAVYNVVMNSVNAKIVSHKIRLSCGVHLTEFKNVHATLAVLKAALTVIIPRASAT